MTMGVDCLFYSSRTHPISQPFSDLTDSVLNTSTLWKQIGCLNDQFDWSGSVGLFHPSQVVQMTNSFRVFNNQLSWSYNQPALIDCFIQWIGYCMDNQVIE